jgi:hypothetical protein
MGAFAGFLLLASAVGGLDVGYFHVHRFRLAARRTSRWETVAHLAQSATFLPLCVCAAVAPERRSFVAVLFALHFAAIAADVLLEKASRASFGGLLPAEYLLHVVGAASTGGALAAFLSEGSLVVSAWQRVALLGVVVGGVVVSLVELRLLIGASRAAFSEVDVSWERASMPKRDRSLTQGAQS